MHIITKPDVQIPLGKHKWKPDIETDVNETWCEDVD